MTERRPGIGGGVALVLAVYGIALAADVPRAKEGPVRIGYLASLSEAGGGGLRDAFRAGLRDLGDVEGDNVLVEHRWANGDYTRLPALARELVQLDLGLIVSAGGPSTARALEAAISTIPIVFVTAARWPPGSCPGRHDRAAISPDASSSPRSWTTSDWRS